MKRKLLILLSVLLLSMFSACGVSQSDYDSLQTKYDSLDQEYSDLEEEYKTLSSDYANCSEQLEHILNQEINPPYTTNYIFTDNYSMAASWVLASFGENATYSEIGNISDKSSDKYFQVVIPTGYTLQDADAYEVFERIKKSIPVLSLCGLEYKVISLQFLYENSGLFINFSLILDDDENYVLDSVCGDLQNINQISNSLP